MSAAPPCDTGKNPQKCDEFKKAPQRLYGRQSNYSDVRKNFKEFSPKHNSVWNEDGREVVWEVSQIQSIQ